MSAKKLVTPEELAERLNLRVKSGKKAGALNVEYVREKARKNIWPCVRMKGSRFIRFDPEVVAAIESGTLGGGSAGPASSLKTERIHENEPHPQRKERHWR